MKQAQQANKHNNNCEEALGLFCTCSCGTSGHGTSLLHRAMRCGDDPGVDYEALVLSLDRVLGAFHAGVDDFNRCLRKGRASVSVNSEAGGPDAKRGLAASRFESTILDEALHQVLIRVGESPGTSKLLPFVEAISINCVDLMVDVIKSAGGTRGIPGKRPRLGDEHLWCSYVSAYLAARLTGSSEMKSRSAIVRPRPLSLRLPALIDTLGVRDTALACLSEAISNAEAQADDSPFSRRVGRGLSEDEINTAMALVALTCCPDLWCHPFVVSTCLAGNVGDSFASHIRIPSYKDEFFRVTHGWRLTYEYGSEGGREAVLLPGYTPNSISWPLVAGAGLKEVL